MAGKRGELDWYTVKYKDIYTVIIVIALIVLAGAGGYIYWRVAGNPEAKAERAIARAKKLMETIEKADLTPDQKNALNQTRPTFESAEAAKREKKYAQAFEISSDLIETLEGIRRGLGEQKFATLQEVEGQVEVKKAGQHLFSSGKDGMPLESGDIVKTGKDGSCRVKLHTGAINVVTPDTLMVLQISVNPGGGSKVKTTVNEGTVEMRTPENLKENEQSVLAGKNTTVTTPADSRATVTQDKGGGKTRTILMAGTGTVEGPGGQTQILTPGLALDATEAGLGTPQALVLPPTPESPMDGEILRAQDPSRTPIVLRWTGASGGTIVQISGKPLFTKTLGERVVKESSLTLEGLPAGTYYWRIKAPGDPAKTFWSDTRKFRLTQIFQNPQIKRDLKLKVESTLIGDGVILQGTTDPGVSVSVNNVEIPVNADGSFNKIVLFGSVGTQQIVVRAFDDQGNEKLFPFRFKGSSD